MLLFFWQVLFSFFGEVVQTYSNLHVVSHVYLESKIKGFFCSSLPRKKVQVNDQVRNFFFIKFLYLMIFKFVLFIPLQCWRVKSAGEKLDFVAACVD